MRIQEAIRSGTEEEIETLTRALGKEAFYSVLGNNYACASSGRKKARLPRARKSATLSNDKAG